VTPHAWNQGKDLGDLSWKYHNDMNNPMSMKRVGIPSTWYEAFHTYGCRITPEVTTYYCDNIEIGHHPTLPVSKTAPFYFLINLATGGGWPVDISRYGKVDMYVDWVRVYAQDSPATP
jgi:beta-glucanase (GH16 family)